MSPPKPHKANWTHMQDQKNEVKLKQKAPHEEQMLSNVCRKMVSYGEICKGETEGSQCLLIICTCLMPPQGGQRRDVFNF